MTDQSSRLLRVLLLSVAALAFAATASACPFCTAISNTISGDLEDATAAVVARCVSVSTETNRFRRCRMRVAEVLRGDPGLKNLAVEVATNRDVREGGLFLMIAYDNALRWTAPTDVSPAGIEYVRGLRRLPASGPERLAYFLRFLQHKDDLVANDAYNEFAKASLEEVAALKDKLDRQWVSTQLRDPSVPLHRRRLYWTFLSLCGDADDTRIFDELIRDRQAEATYERGLDAAIACFISLGGEEALARIERDYLVNSEADYTDTYAAIRAIRVHGEELKKLPRERLTAALRLVLQRPALADLVMQDLAQWEDWSAMERIVELFKTATEDTSFLKLAAVRYLKACPLPTALESLEELRAIDPKVLRQADSLFPTAASVPAPPAQEPEAVVSTAEKSEPPANEPQDTGSVDDRARGIGWYVMVAFLLSSAVVGAFAMVRRLR